MDLNHRQPTIREAKTALHVSNGTLTRHLEKLRKEDKLPAARKPGGMKTITGKEITMTDKKPATTSEANETAKRAVASELDRLKNYIANEEANAPANVEPVGEDYADYANPVRQLERYITILDDFAAETIRINRTQYEAIKGDPTFIFADHNSLNDLLKLRHSMTALIKALKDGAVDK